MLKHIGCQISKVQIYCTGGGGGGGFSESKTNIERTDKTGGVVPAEIRENQRHAAAQPGSVVC